MKTKSTKNIFQTEKMIQLIPSRRNILYENGTLLELVLLIEDCITKKMQVTINYIDSDHTDTLSPDTGVFVVQIIKELKVPAFEKIIEEGKKKQIITPCTSLIGKVRTGQTVLFCHKNYKLPDKDTLIRASLTMNAAKRMIWSLSIGFDYAIVFPQD